MHIKVRQKGAVAVSFWMVVPGFIIAVLIAFFTKLTFAFVFLLLWCAVFIPCGIFYFLSFNLYVGNNYLFLRHGVFFKFVHLMPKRHITGCHTLCIEMQKNTKTAVLILLCASGFYIVPGVTVNDAKKVADLLFCK